MNTYRTTIKYLLVLVLAILFMGTGIAWYLLEDTLGRHIQNAPETPRDRGMSFERVELTARDGVRLVGWYITPSLRPRAGAVILHGLEETAGGKSEPYVLNTAEALYHADIASFALDMRSFGESEGDKITLGIEEWMDAESAYDYLRTRPELADKKIGFIGDSMGGAVAIAVAARSGKGDFVVASAPLENYRTAFRTWLVADGYPAFLSPFVQLAGHITLGTAYSRYDTDKLIENISSPIFISAPERDKQVGTDGKRLFARARSHPQNIFWQPVGSTHVLVDNFRDEFEQRLIKFIE